MNITGINSYNDRKNPTFNSRLKSLNVLNPVSYYGDRYFCKAAKISSSHYNPVISELIGKIDVVCLNSGKSTKISAWDINPNKSSKYVLFLHGMAQNVSDYQKLYKTILDNNIGVFALEYRSYGINQTTHLSEDNLRKDVKCAYKYLTEQKHINPEDIIIVGHSMGGALGTYLASVKKNIKSLILIAPIPNMAEVGEKFAKNKNLGEGVPDLLLYITNKIKPLRWLTSLRFNSIGKIKKVEAQTYIIQSKNDSVATIGGVRKIAKNARRKDILKEFITLPSGGHKVDEQKINAVGEILSSLY